MLGFYLNHLKLISMAPPLSIIPLYGNATFKLVIMFAANKSRGEVGGTY